MTYGELTLNEIIKEYYDNCIHKFCVETNGCKKCRLKILCDSMSFDKIRPLLSKEMETREQYLNKRLKMCGLDLLLEEYTTEDIVNGIVSMSEKRIKNSQ